jgi:FkbM family methyltransferase
VPPALQLRLAYGERETRATVPASSAGPIPWEMVLDLGPPVPGDTVVRLHWEAGPVRVGHCAIPLAGLRDATPMQTNISTATLCRVSGRFEVHGWGFPAPGALVLLINGRLVAHTARRHRRSDVAERFPWTDGLDLGWTLSGQCGQLLSGPVSFSLCSSQGVTGIELAPGHERFRVHNDRGRWNRVRIPIEHALWRLVPLALRQSPLAWHRALLASQAFWRRWHAHPDGLAALLRRAVVNSLIDRNGLGGPMWLRLSSGDLVLSSPGTDAVISRRFLLDGHYEGGFLRWVAGLLAPGETVIDGGAAFGSFSLAAARAVGPQGRVLAIEANPATRELLMRTLARNPHGRCVKVAPVAIGSHAERRSFADVSLGNAGASRLLEAGEAVDDVATDLDRLTVVSLARDTRGQPVPPGDRRTRVRISEVEVTTLDALCRQHALRDVALLKLDIEGHELNAVRGAQGLLDGAFGLPPVVALEYSRLMHTAGGTPEDLFAQFARRGWTAWRLSGSKSTGGQLVRVPDAASAPEHDNLVFVPPAHAARLGLSPA